MKIITLTLSPALDVTYRIPGEISLGLNRAESFSITAGGKGINVARSIAREAKRCGVDANYTAIYPSGGEIGELLTQSLAAEGITTLPVKTDAACRINVSAIDSAGRDIEINSRGAKLKADELSRIEDALNVLTRGDVLAICGSVPDGVEKSYYAELIGKMSSRGITCVLDCDGEALQVAVCGECPPDYVKPNEHEIRDFCERIGADVSPEAIVKASRGRCAVIATYGGRGAAIIRPRGDKTEKISADATPVEPMRLKGAGDTLLGAYLYYKFVKNESDSEALSAAVEVAGKYVAGE